MIMILIWLNLIIQMLDAGAAIQISSRNNYDAGKLEIVSRIVIMIRRS